MPTVSFMPWFTVSQPMTVGNFELIPFQTQIPNPSPAQAGIIQILNMYKLHHGPPISSATVFKHIDKAIDDDVTADEMDEIFIIANLLAVGGLSSRKYFSETYVSTTNFESIVQKYQSPSNGVAIASKRRGPYSQQMYFQGVFSEKCPSYVSIKNNYLVDESLTQVLWAASRSLPEELWNRIYESILSYLSANTDIRQVNEYNEVVMLTAAFERLLNKKGNAFQLKNAFVKSFQSHPQQEIAILKKVIPSRSKVMSLKDKVKFWAKEYEMDFLKLKGVFEDPYDSHRMCKSLRALWLTDFYKVRNRFAHGHRTLAHNSLWSPEEHLLIGSYIFPYLLKILLAEKKLYQLSNGDRRGIWTFDFLTSKKNLFEFDQQYCISDWDKAISEAVWAPPPQGYQII